MNKYIELSVSTNSVWAECIAEILIDEVGCFGVVSEEVEYKDEVIIKDNRNLVKAYLWFNELQRPDVDAIQQLLLEKRAIIISSGVDEDLLGSWNVSSTDIEDEDWAHNWKKFWHVQKIATRTVICPSWEEYHPSKDEIFISLDPGTAFGTGTHASTRLCIAGLENFMKKGFKVADIGTGSGILAIVAAKLGADSVIAVDNDPSVIEVALTNAKKNNVEDLCTFYTGSAVDVEGPFDVIIVNILANVIVDIFEDIIKLAKDGTKFILSGIIEEKKQFVIDNAQRLGLKLIDVYKEPKEPHWVGIIVEK